LNNHQAFVLDLESETTRRLTFEDPTDSHDWTDRGDSVVYGVTGTGLFIRAADGSGEARLVVPVPTGSIIEVSVRGGWVAFGFGDRTTMDVMIANRDSGGPPTPYAATPFREHSPAISPDGRWLAYLSDESGRQEVYVSAFPVPAGRVIVSIGGGAEPAWSDDGRTLYYRTRDDDGFVAAEVAPDEESFAIRARSAVMHYPAEIESNSVEYDVRGSDGAFIVVGVGRDATRGNGILVVTNAVTNR